MKTLSLCAVILFSIFSINTSTAQTAKKETIKVWGNCGMCKKTIEKSARSAGATAASWNEESKELTVSYAANKTSGAKIQEAIAKSGYDTQDLTADNKAYEKLPGCCQYERKDATANKDEKKGSGHAGCKHDAKDMSGSKEKSCCSKTAGTMNDKKSCDHANCKHEGAAMTCSKDKSCCNKAAGTGTDKKCCDDKSCKHDSKESVID